MYAKHLFAAKEAPQGDAARISEFASLRYLIIEDSSTMRVWLRNAIVGMGGKTIDQSSTYGDALMRIRGRDPYDVIICDYILSDKRDGQQLLEECRTAKLIKSSVVWIMVTGESAYEQVFSAAELAPDDYIIKPLTPSILGDRLTACFERRKALKPVTDFFDAGRFDSCAKVAEQLQKRSPRYRFDYIRVGAEALMASGRYDDAYDVYQNVLVDRPRSAWAKLGAARAYFHLERYDESQDLLESLIKDNPDFLQSHDWLARIHDQKGDHEQSKAILKEIITKNPKALHRHREVARLALDSGDTASALAAYETMFRHAGGSSSVRPQDFCSYSLMLANQNDQVKLKNLGEQMRDWYQGKPNFKFADATVRFSQAAVAKDKAKVQACYSEMKQAMVSTANEFPVDLKLSMLNAAIMQGDDTTAINVATDLATEYAQNESMTKRLISTLNDAGFAPEARQIANLAQAQMVSLNSLAVDLAKKGRIKEAVEEFTRIADSTRNLSVVLNAALALCRLAAEDCLTEQQISKLVFYLEYVQNKDADNPKLKRLYELAEPFVPKRFIEKVIQHTVTETCQL